MTMHQRSKPLVRTAPRRPPGVNGTARIQIVYIHGQTYYFGTSRGRVWATAMSWRPYARYVCTITGEQQMDINKCCARA